MFSRALQGLGQPADWHLPYSVLVSPVSSPPRPRPRRYGASRPTARGSSHRRRERCPAGTIESAGVQMYYENRARTATGTAHEGDTLCIFLWQKCYRAYYIKTLARYLYISSRHTHTQHSHEHRQRTLLDGAVDSSAHRRDVEARVKP